MIDGLPVLMWVADRMSVAPVAVLRSARPDDLEG